MAIRGRMRGLLAPPTFLFWRLTEGSPSAPAGLSFSASSLLLLPALSSFSSALMALRPSAPPEHCSSPPQPEALEAGAPCMEST